MSPREDDAPHAVREFNSARVVAAIRDGRAVTRADLGTHTGLSRSTVTSIVSELIATGTVLEVGSVAGQPGRPTRRLAMAASADLVVAVDFGHSHCRVGIVDAQGETLADEHARFDVDSSATDAIAHARAAVARLLASPAVHRERVVGGAIGLPAPVDVGSGSVGAGNVLPRWVGREPARELADALGIPFAVDNDANLGALAECRFGVARGLDDLIYVKASTGVGAGFVLGGRVHHGATGRAGEIGHVPVDPSGAVCRCGNRGCLETVASVGQVLAALAPRNGGPMTMAHLGGLVDAGDVGAVRVVCDAGRMIGRVVADAVNNLNPSMVVVGGELAGAGSPLLDGVCESIERYAQPEITRALRVELSAFGSRSEYIGAAALAHDRAAARG